MRAQLSEGSHVRVSDKPRISEMLQSIEHLLSAPRLARYRQGASDDLSVLAIYCWNVQLSEALVPCLNFVETSLRNSLDIYLADRFNRSDWYDAPGFLLWSQARARDTAIQKINDEGKTVTPGRVVAAVTFGFWVDILSGGYSQASHPDGIWDHRGIELAKVFPNASAQDLASRKKIDRRFRAMRNLRNRIFHYECIFDDPGLPLLHAAVVESIGWIHTDMHALMQSFDRFLEVYQSGILNSERNLRRSFDQP